MTRLEPTLVVSRLVVRRNEHIAYDEKFHAGLNIIRGENSSGKSTILNFIFYGLGGDLTDWSDTAKLCTGVYLEVLLNGQPATLFRSVSPDLGRPMEIFGGTYTQGIAAPREEWIRYPYRRSSNMESFSQALFRLLNIPEVVSETTGNVTIHQILRLLYADQLSPVESLFRFERFDSPTLRDTVGRLLCGAYDGTLYQNELRIRELEKDYDAANAELKSILAILGTASNSGLTLDWIDAERSALTKAREETGASIEAAEVAVFTAAKSDELSLKAQEQALREVQKSQAAITANRQSLDKISLDIADSADFIRALEGKLEALRDAKDVADAFGEVRFSMCPACYAALPKDKAASSLICHLCKTPFDQARSQGRIVALINDTAIQLKQSRQLQERRNERLEGARQQLQTAEAQWKRAAARLTELQRLPSSETREALRELHRRAGYLDRQLEDLDERAKIIGRLSSLQQRRDSLNDEINALKSRNQTLRAQQSERLSIAYTAIEAKMRGFLSRDLPRQDSFENPQRIEFEFGGNKISVDGHTYFSASSRVILKSSFVLALLAAATEHAFFRHPRFVMIDTMEDKGMEMLRSHNFQMLVADVSAKAPAEHQIIFATAMIVPELDEDEYTIGKQSRQDERTLAIQ